MADTAVSIDPWAVRRMTAVSGNAVASGFSSPIPSTTGMIMSAITTDGRKAGARSSASLPSTASCTS
jgi:hypothetical protein